MAETASSTSAKKQHMIKLGIFVKRHPSLTSEEFHECAYTVFDMTFSEEPGS
jgi:hypothetical protein